MRTLGQQAFTGWKLKFAVLLPIVQLGIATALLAWAHKTSEPKGLDTPFLSTAALVCYGVNAPALAVKLFGMLLVALTNRPLSIHGVGIEDAWFLGGVGVVWYLMGRKIDRLQSAGPFQKHDTLRTLAIVENLLLFLLGIALFSLAVQAFLVPWKWNNRTGNIAEGILFLAWSLVLIIFPGRKLVNTVRGWASLWSGV